MVGEGAAAASGGTAGGVGGAGAGLCANATELNASPRAVIFREDGMCIGNTSARHSASRVPFLETAEVLQSPHIEGIGDFPKSLDPTAIRSLAVWIAYRAFVIAEALGI